MLQKIIAIITQLDDVFKDSNGTLDFIIKLINLISSLSEEDQQALLNEMDHEDIGV